MRAALELDDRQLRYCVGANSGEYLAPLEGRPADIDVFFPAAITTEALRELDGGDGRVELLDGNTPSFVTPILLATPVADDRVTWYLSMSPPVPDPSCASFTL